MTEPTDQTATTDVTDPDLLNTSTGDQDPETDRDPDLDSGGDD
jgi:hypothetical protein